jgi:uncharacterized integral membrane protein
VYKQDGGGAEPLEKKQGVAISGGVIGFGLIAAAVLVFIFQNTQDVDVEFLWFDFSWPLWLIIVVTIVLSCIGWVLAGILRRHRRRKDRREDRRD